MCCLSEQSRRKSSSAVAQKDNLRRHLISLRQMGLQCPLLFRYPDQQQQRCIGYGKDQGRIPGSKKCWKGKYLDGDCEVVGMFEITVGPRRHSAHLCKDDDACVPAASQGSDRPVAKNLCRYDQAEKQRPPI